ncbi:MAG: hypothetical protein V3V08_01140 [Nannocystaceae bacterium]
METHEFLERLHADFLDGRRVGLTTLSATSAVRIGGRPQKSRPSGDTFSSRLSSAEVDLDQFTEL